MTLPNLGYKLGFKDFIKPKETNISIVGEIPIWLNGVYLKNGPGKFDLGQQTLKHWFDGLSLITKFHFINGKVTYESTMQDTKEARYAIKEGKLRSLQFGTQIEQTFLQKLITLLSGANKLGDNTCVNIIPNGLTALTLTETPIINSIDIANLDQVQTIKFPNEFNYQLTTAHPEYDPITKKLINLGISVGAKNAYNIFEMDINTYGRNLICSIPVKNPSYHHSFAVSEKYIILFDSPLKLNPISLLFSSKGIGKSFIENYQWNTKNGTKLIVIDRDKKSVVNEIITDPFMMFHTGNCYLEGDELIVDVAIYDDSTIIENLYLPNLLQGRDFCSAKLTRFRLNLQQNTCKKETYDQFGCEFPRYNFKHSGQKYKYLYTAGFNENTDFINLLNKWDLLSGNKQIWQQDNCYVGEPIFIPKPTGVFEDDGVVLSIILDTQREICFLLILDAKSWQEIARVELDHLLPYGFHGNFAFMKN